LAFCEFKFKEITNIQFEVDWSSQVDGILKQKTQLQINYILQFDFKTNPLVIIIENWEASLLFVRPFEQIW
jgi:hypothetical protein